MIDKANDSRYDECPVCGGWKRKVAKTCRKCRFFDMNYTPSGDDGIKDDRLTSEWLHQFRGLFWGEGSAMILKNGSTYTTGLALVLRADDKDVIFDIQSKLGGRVLYYDAPRRRRYGNPQYSWKVSDLEQVAEICRLLLDGNLIPAKKVGDVERVLAFCEFRLPNRFRLIGDDDRREMKRRYRELLRYRRFRE